MANSAVLPTKSRLTVSLAEAAAMLGISARSMRRLSSTGEVPVVRLGRRVLVARADLDALVAAHRTPVLTVGHHGTHKQKTNPKGGSR